MMIWAIALVLVGALAISGGWMLCALGFVGGIMAAIAHANEDEDWYGDRADADESSPEDGSPSAASCVRTAVIGAGVAIVGALAALTGLGLGITAAIQRLLA